MKLFKSRKSLTIFIISINLLFIGGLTFGEWQYISSSRENAVKANKESFAAANNSLSSMTNNYLLGESHLCRSWARYLNQNTMTMNEAKTFVSQSIIDSDVVAHIINRETYVGVSTKPHKNDSSDYSVEYTSDLISKVFTSQNEGVKTSPEYTDPINLISSIAFYTEVTLKDDVDPSLTYDAYLMRIIPTSNLATKWTFPSSFQHLEVAVIDNSSEENIGAYVFHQKSFKSTSFFNYYRSYNLPSSQQLADLIQEVTTNSGTMTMKDSAGKELFMSYSQIANQEKWTIITTIPMEDIRNVSTDWLTITIIGIGLGALFIIDLIILLILNKNLQDTTKVAESANKAKTEFLSTMSHDIRTPMNAIVGLTNIASRDTRNPESTQDALRKIALASEHLLTLINDILDISKVESGKLTLNPLPFSILDTFENLVNISQPVVKSKNINFTHGALNIDHEWLYADKLRLNQIFTNLLSNALKYTEENGKVSLEIKELPNEKEGYVTLIYQVADTGIGMSKEYLEKMYQPFNRATDSRVNSIQGTGLGLTITKRMVDLLEGKIECQSEVGKGTTFIVTIDLPIYEKPVEEVASHNHKEINGASAEEETNLEGTKVLVVEDNDINYEIVSTLLGMHGIVCQRAENGKVAYELIKEKGQEEPFDLIFMDVQMPVMNGLDATKAIRNLDFEYAKKVPIIAMTADAFSENVAECLAAGMNAHIAKPIDLNLVLAEIRKVKNK